MPRDWFRRVFLCAGIVVLAACGDDPIDNDDDDDNNAPNAVLQAETEAMRGVVVELDGSGSNDPDGDNLTYEWSFTTRPAGSGATITGADDEIASFVPDVIGSYVIRLTVSDGDDNDVATTTIVVDVQALGSISSDSVIHNTTSPAGQPDYRIDDFNLVTFSADVTIEPGVTIAMGEGSGIDVEVGGSLSAVGTAALPIRFIGENDVAGHWNNIEIESNNSANELTFVEIANGGGNTFGAVYLTGRVRMTNSTVTHSGDYGLESTSAGQLPGFANNTFSDNELASMFIPAQLLGSLDAASHYAGTGDGVVEVFSGPGVSGTQTWPAIDAPIRLQDFAFIDIQGNVTIQPGARFVMGESSSIQVSTGGSLSAVGTAADTIAFIGANNVQGHWNNFEFDSNNSANRLSYVEIAHGGGNNFGAVYVEGTVRIDHTLIRDSGDFGIDVTSSGLLPQFSENRFRNNLLGPLTIPANLIGSLDAATVYGDGNGVNFIDVYGTSTGSTQTWRKTDIPFRLRTSNFLTVNSAVTVDPGFRMMMGEATSIEVATGGSMIAHGTAADSIRFVGAQPTPGYWNNFEFSSNAANSLSYVEIGYGGGNSFGMVYVDGTVSIANGRLHHSEDWAVEVTPSGNFVGTANTYHDNALGSVD